MAALPSSYLPVLTAALRLLQPWHKTVRQSDPAEKWWGRNVDGLYLDSFSEVAVHETGNGVRVALSLGEEQDNLFWLPLTQDNRGTRALFSERIFCILLWGKGCCSRWLLVCFGAQKSDPKLQLLCLDFDSSPSQIIFVLFLFWFVFLIHSFFQFAIPGKILFGRISGSWWTLLLSRKYEPQL